MLGVIRRLLCMIGILVVPRLTDPSAWTTWAILVFLIIAGSLEFDKK
jgi:hypothetical protein